MSKKLAIIAFLGLTFVTAKAQTVVSPIPDPHMSFVNAVGLACAGCKLSTFAAGTTTSLATFTDSTGAVQNTNPVILDLTGSANIWGSQSSYKFVLMDPLGNTLFTEDNIPVVCTLVSCPPATAASIGAVSLTDTSVQTMAGPLNVTGSLNASAPGNFSPLAPSTCTNTGYVNGASLDSPGIDFPGLPVVNGICGGVIVPSNFPTAITGGSSTSTTITVTVASLPSAFQVVGLPIMVTGALPAGFNTPPLATPPATLATVVSFTGSTLTYTSTNNPGAWSSGGTLSVATVLQANGTTGFVNGLAQGVTLVGAAGQAQGFAPGEGIFGANFVAQAQTGATGSGVTGIEVDVDTQVPTAGITAISIPSVWDVAPPTSSAVVVTAPGGTANAQYGRVFVSGNGTSAVGLQLGTGNNLAISGPSPSQVVQFLSGTVGVDTPPSTIGADAAGDIVVTPVAGQSFNSTGPLTGPSSNVSGIATAADVRSTDGSTASLTMASTAGENFLLSENSALNASANLNISGPGAAVIPIVDISATATLLGGSLSNLNGTLIPSTATGFVGPTNGAVVLALTSATMPSTCTAGSLWLNPAPTSASTVLAVCFPANTFTFVTVP